MFRDKLYISILPQFISAILSLITIRLYTEYLNSVDLGKLMLVLAGLAFFDALFSSAINQTIFYFSSDKEKRNYLLQKVFAHKTRFFIPIIFLILCTFVLLVYIDLNIYLFLTSMIFIMLCYILIEPIKASFFSILNISVSRKLYGFQIVIEAISNFIFIFISLSFNSKWYVIVFSIIFSRFIILLTLNFFLKKNVKLSKLSNNHVVSKVDFLNYFKSISMMGVLGWVSSFFDRYIIGFLLGFADAGLYSITTGLAGRPYNILTSSLSAHFKPKLFKSVNNKSYFLNFKKWFVNAFILGIIGIILFALFKDYLVKLLVASEYRLEISNLIVLASIAFTFNILTHSLDNIFLSKGFAQKLFKTQLFLVTSICFVALGAFFHGLLGALYAKIIAEFFKLAVMSHLTIKILK